MLGEVAIYVILLPLAHLIIWYDRAVATIKEWYYTIAGIPYYRCRGKFNNYIVRLDK